MVFLLKSKRDISMDISGDPWMLQGLFCYVSGFWLFAGQFQEEVFS